MRAPGECYAYGAFAAAIRRTVSLAVGRFPRAESAVPMVCRKTPSRTPGTYRALTIRYTVDGRPPPRGHRRESALGPTPPQPRSARGMAVATRACVPYGVPHRAARRPFRLQTISPYRLGPRASTGGLAARITGLFAKITLLPLSRKITLA